MYEDLRDMDEETFYMGRLVDNLNLMSNLYINTILMEIAKNGDEELFDRSMVVMDELHALIDELTDDEDEEEIEPEIDEDADDEEDEDEEDEDE